MSSKPALLAEVSAGPSAGAGVLDAAAASAGELALLTDIVPASCVDGPGNRFVVFFQGCGFDCRACHNPHTIPQRRVGTSWWASLGDVLDRLRPAAPFLSGVTVSGGEATLQWRFVRALFAAIAGDAELAHLTTLVDSNGDTTPEVWEALAPTMDGAMIDLKALDAGLHEWLTGRSNDRVRASITRLHQLGRLHEVRLLLIPGVNDREGDLAGVAHWLVEHAPGVPVRLNGFRRHGVRAVAGDFDDATAGTLSAAADALARHGLDSVLVTAWSPAD